MPAGRAEVSFDRVAAEYDETRGGAARAAASAGGVATHLLPGNVLEVGVGTGIVAKALLDKVSGVRLVGVDISARMLAVATGRLPGRLVRGSAQRLPFPPGRFDDVVMVHVLHLVPDLATTLAEAARVLRRGGRLVAVHGAPVHDTDDELTEATRDLQALRDVRADTPTRVTTAAAAVGLRLVSQLEATPQRAAHSPAGLADSIERRSWSYLWAVDDAQWAATVEPVVARLRALPDPDRPRSQQGRMTVTVLERADG
jgi:SAM-dependent methyltransferase